MSGAEEPSAGRDRAAVGLLAAVCYLPLLLTHRGQVGADTKTYLYLDPDRLLRRAWSMWDPNVGLGTVPHQNIGYLWPMGPYYWLFEHLGVPDWIAQRLWLGSILFGAGLGVRYLMRTLGQSGPGVTAAMFLYALSPYVLTLGARISGLLLPFTALGWLIGLTIRAGRDRGWLHPALFALAVPTFGSVNATALLLVGLAPALWLPYAVFALRELRLRDALAVAARIGSLTVFTSAWWIVGLWCQGSFGIDVLRYTETARTVADASSAPEVLRGLGYWYFYGNDKLGPWIEPSDAYTQSPVLIAVTYAVPIIGLLAAGIVRWRYRGYFVSLIVAGLVLAVGAHPWDEGAPLGRGFQAFLSAQVGLAMRSLPRAVPLLTLGLSVLTGVAVGALARARPRLERPVAAGLVLLAIAALPPLWLGQMVADNLQRDEELPAYWIEAAAAIDERGRAEDPGDGFESRVLELPGSDFASYRWGNTVDPITPGLTDRPFAARELIPYGTPLSADLLNSLDRPLQESTLEPEALAPIARLMGVGDLVFRADLTYERFNLARPRQVYELLGMAPGVTSVATFGDGVANEPDPSLPLEDEEELAADPDLPDPPAVGLWEVEGDPSIVSAKPASSTVLVSGNGDGLVAVAAAGLITGDELIRYSGSFAADGGGGDDALVAALADGGAVVLTDTNRRAGHRWGTVSDTDGHTEAVGEEALDEDLGDNRLPIFPGADPTTQTVKVEGGGVVARASSYGNGITYTPENRAANAVDDDYNTAWTTGAFASVIGERIELTYDEPRTTGGITLLQSARGLQNRWITEVALTFDGGDRVVLELDETSREGLGQHLDVGSRTFNRLTIEITDAEPGRRDSYEDLSAVGFADIRLADDDVRAVQSVRLPTDALDALGSASDDLPLAIVLTRLRTRPTAALRTDPEPRLVRDVSLPTLRRFALSGTVRLSATAPDQVIDALLGLPGFEDGGVTATSSRRLSGDLTARAGAAIDGDPTTHWSPGYLGQDREWTAYRSATPVSFDHMDVTVVADGRHSVPTRLRIVADGGDPVYVDLPAVEDRPERDAAVTLRVDLPEPVAGTEIVVNLDRVREVETIDWISEDEIVTPVGIVEWGIPGLSVEVPDGPFDTGCRDDLVVVDEAAIAVRAAGTVAGALAGAALPLTPCDPAGVALPAGPSQITTQDGFFTGLQVDDLTLRSAPGGDPDDGSGPVLDAEAGPDATVVAAGRWRSTIEVGPRESDTWLVIGQSHNDGWRATIDGEDLGPPQPVDGYSSAFLIPAGPDPVTVEVVWWPQRVVNVALGVSAVAVLGTLAVAVAALLRRRRRAAADDDATAPDVPPDERALPLSRWSILRSDAVLAWPVTAAVAVAATLAGLLAINPAAAAGLGVAAVLAARVPRARPVVTLGPAGLLAVSATYVLALQVRYGLPSGFEWPTRFARVHGVAYASVLLLAVGAVTDRLRANGLARNPPAGNPSDV